MIVEDIIPTETNRRRFIAFKLAELMRRIISTEFHEVGI